MNGKSQRLWVVSELYYPEQTSTGYFVTRIAEGLQEDFEVKIISGLPSYSERHIEVQRRERRGKTTIHRMISTRFAKDNLIGRLINIVTFTLSASLFFLFRARSGDTVLVLTNPPTLPFTIAWISRMKSVRSCLLVHDVYPEVLVATGYLNPKGRLNRLLGIVSAHGLRIFDEVIVLGRDMEAIAKTKIGNARTGLRIIPNWGDIYEILPLNRASNPFLVDHELQDRTVIQFSGNLGRTHNIEMVMRVAESLIDRPDIVFLFVGYGGKSSLIARWQEERSLPNVRLLPRQSREMLNPMLSSATASVIAFVDGMYGVSVPSRMYNVMSAGVPIIAIAHRESELALTTKEHDCGWVLANNDDQGLRDLILQLAGETGKSIAAEKGANGRRAAERYFTLEVVLQKFRALFTS